MVGTIVEHVGHEQDHGRVTEFLHQCETSLVSRRRSPALWTIGAAQLLANSSDLAFGDVDQRRPVAVAVPGTTPPGSMVSLRKRSSRSRSLAGSLPRSIEPKVVSVTPTAGSPTGWQPVGLPAVGVTNTTLGSIDLGEEPAKLRDRELRPPQADHRTRWRGAMAQPRRPAAALIYVAEGEIHESPATSCADRPQGGRDLRREARDLRTGENLGDTAVILLVADVLHDRGDHNM